MSRRRSPQMPDLAAYTGKWVAMSRKRVIAAGSSLADVMQKVSSLLPRQSPSVFLVPRRDEGPYVLVMRCHRW